jgi:hypothetical protein
MSYGIDELPKVGEEVTGVNVEWSTAPVLVFPGHSPWQNGWASIRTSDGKELTLPVIRILGEPLVSHGPMEFNPVTKQYDFPSERGLACS